MKRNKTDANAEKARDKSEAAKTAYANNIHVKRLGYLLDAAELMSDAYPNVSRAYVRELREVAQKHVIRLDPSFKRSFCKGCNTVLLPGINAIVRAESHGKQWQRAPGNVCERTLGTDRVGHLNTEAAGEQILDESLFNWMSVTCSVCTRTRRTKLEQSNILPSSITQERVSTEPEMQLS
ncbi:RNAse P subunit domain containing protein [Babesia ovis]|uniref:RNAse P subunit domain containing protein n=1 Tax=Babesia ovis TaxID=5869 RepID=A0A9W5WUJ5_BABOV|nr:RNAse P subunit domain containing protein [Babesia ovis]